MKPMEQPWRNKQSDVPLLLALGFGEYKLNYRYSVATRARSLWFVLFKSTRMARQADDSAGRPIGVYKHFTMSMQLCIASFACTSPSEKFKCLACINSERPKEIEMVRSVVWPKAQDIRIT